MQNIFSLYDVLNDHLQRLLWRRVLSFTAASIQNWDIYLSVKLYWTPSSSKLAAFTDLPRHAVVAELCKAVKVYILDVKTQRQKRGHPMNTLCSLRPAYPYIHRESNGTGCSFNWILAAIRWTSLVTLSLPDILCLICHAQQSNNQFPFILHCNWSLIIVCEWTAIDADTETSA